MRRNTNAEEYGTHGNFENVLSSAADVFKLYIKSTYNIGKLIVLQGSWFTTIRYHGTLQRTLLGRCK